jgi:hypothetical protein
MQSQYNWHNYAGRYNWDMQSGYSLYINLHFNYLTISLVSGSPTNTTTRNYNSDTKYYY